MQRLLKVFPSVRRLINRVDALQGSLASLQAASGFVPPGHFYSPIPSLDEVRQDADRIFANGAGGAHGVPAVPGIDLREAEQLKLAHQLADFYAELPFGAQKQDGLRYYFENEFYSYAD